MLYSLVADLRLFTAPDPQVGTIANVQQRLEFAQILSYSRLNFPSSQFLNERGHSRVKLLPLIYNICRASFRLKGESPLKAE